MKILTGFAVIKDSVGNRITYTYSEVNQEGTIISSNNKESFVVMDEGLKLNIKAIEDFITAKIEVI